MGEEQKAKNDLAEAFRKVPSRGRESVIEILRDADEQGTRKIVLSSRVVPQQKAPSPKRRHTMTSIAGVVKYLGRYGKSSSVVFVSPKERKVFVVLDETAADGFETLYVEVGFHPAFEPWKAILGKAQPVKELHSFLRLRRDFVQDGAQVAHVLSRVSGSTETEAIEDQNARDGVTQLLVKTKIRGAPQGSQPVSIPDRLRITAPLFLESAPTDHLLDLVLEVSGASVSGSLQYPGFEEKLNAEFEAVVAPLHQVAEKIGFVVVHGTPQTERWEFVQPVSDAALCARCCSRT